jgi:hypothetical protein
VTWPVRSAELVEVALWPITELLPDAGPDVVLEPAASGTGC